MKRQEGEHYVNDEEFHKLLCRNKELHIICENEEDPKEIERFENERRRVMNEIGKIYLKICKGLLNKPNFINYTNDRKDEMISEACWHMTKYTLSFNTDRNKPFSYFTTTARNGFLQYLNKWKKYTDRFQPLEYIENVQNDDGSSTEGWSD